MLTDRLKGSFLAVVRGRGSAYTSRVSITRGDHVEVFAIVRGTQVYETSLQAIDHDRIRVSCTCPYFEEGNPCKHLWATAMKAEATGLLGSMRLGSGRIHLLMPGDDDLDDEDDDLDDEDDDLDDEDDDLDDDHVWGLPTYRPVAPPRHRAEAPWREVEKQLSMPSTHKAAPPILYLLELRESYQGATLEIAKPTVSKTAVSPWVSLNVTGQTIEACEDQDDQTILSVLFGDPSRIHYSFGKSSFILSQALFRILLPVLARTGRFHHKTKQENGRATRAGLSPLTVAEPIHRLMLRAEREEKGFVLKAEISGGERAVPMEEARLFFPEFALANGTIMKVMDGGPWSRVLREQGVIRVPDAQWGEFLRVFYASPHHPLLTLPEGYKLAEMDVAPTPCLRVEPPNNKNNDRDPFLAELSFDYGGVAISALRGGLLIPDLDRFRLVRRDLERESAASSKLAEVGFTHGFAADKSPRRVIHKRHFVRAVRALLSEGWKIEAQGKLFRTAGSFKMGVTSGIDWFDLEGSFDFGGVSADLSALLDALRKGDDVVVLGDGTLGMLPEAWMKRLGMFAALGAPQGDRVRFAKTQVSLLDALLQDQPEVRIDEAFSRARDELKRAEGVGPLNAPKSFTGVLREYQREGLGWLCFLERAGLGGCLADDMGLGKTVQVLALLARGEGDAPRGKNNGAPKGKNKGTRRAPSLVVAPRSLIFNWKSEAARFAPHMRVLDHTGASRLSPGEHFEDYDLVLTTYGTLRRDAVALAGVKLRFAILDEAQAIKNADSESAKAARALSADHRLALTGTPVENHLGELWSLFEFLNPGMLGRSSLFQAASGRDPDPALLAALSRALRPFLLRRTKAQVARDLPARTEETMLIPLEGAQRRLYDDLREHYRASLKRRVAEAGLSKSKIVVLEALLRLRQAALHPALLDKKKLAGPSAKLDALMNELPSLAEKGQKALVFSQFTSLLALVKAELDKRAIRYEYLDGQTTDRQERIERFQREGGPPFFLVSLKAGGVGLNLTAAEYVFLLDPWWNPAVEAQAIDRTHRIGQTKPVFAYRLIAEDTIEERILELQAKKRDLAERVIAGDGGLLRGMTVEDLELLLS